MTSLTRRDAIAAAGAVLGLAALPAAARSRRPAGLVGVDGTRFLLAGAPYRYMGANMWYAAYLGADAPYGNRDRLRRELDRLRAVATGARATTSGCSAGSTICWSSCDAATCAR